MPADSWPRCWSAKRPRVATAAAPATAGAPHRAFRGGDGESAARHVLGRGEHPPLRGLPDERLDPSLTIEIEEGGSVAGGDPAERRVGAARESRRRGADEDDRIALLRETRTDPNGDVVEQPDDADLRRGRDRAGRRFVVERDVAARDRQAQGATGVAEAADTFGQLPESFGPRRITVVEAVRDAQ